MKTSVSFLKAVALTLLIGSAVTFSLTQGQSSLRGQVAEGGVCDDMGDDETMYCEVGSWCQGQSCTGTNSSTGACEGFTTGICDPCGESQTWCNRCDDDDDCDEGYECLLFGSANLRYRCEYTGSSTGGGVGGVGAAGGVGGVAGPGPGAGAGAGGPGPGPGGGPGATGGLGGIATTGGLGGPGGIGGIGGVGGIATTGGIGGVGGIATTGGVGGIGGVGGVGGVGGTGGASSAASTTFSSSDTSSSSGASGTFSSSDDGSSIDGACSADPECSGYISPAACAICCFVHGPGACTTAQCAGGFCTPIDCCSTGIGGGLGTTGGVGGVAATGGIGGVATTGGTGGTGGPSSFSSASSLPFSTSSSIGGPGPGPGPGTTGGIGGVGGIATTGGVGGVGGIATTGGGPGPGPGPGGGSCNADSDCPGYMRPDACSICCLTQPPGSCISAACNPPFPGICVPTSCGCTGGPGPGPGTTGGGPGPGTTGGGPGPGSGPGTTGGGPGPGTTGGGPGPGTGPGTTGGGPGPGSGPGTTGGGPGPGSGPGTTGGGPGPGPTSCTSDSDCPQPTLCMGPLANDYCFTESNGTFVCIPRGSCIRNKNSCWLNMCMDIGAAATCPCPGGPGPGPGPSGPGPTSGRSSAISASNVSAGSARNMCPFTVPTPCGPGESSFCCSDGNWECWDPSEHGTLADGTSPSDPPAREVGVSIPEEPESFFAGIAKFFASMFGVFTPDSSTLTANVGASCGAGPVTCSVLHDLENHDFVHIEASGSRVYGCKSNGRRFQIFPLPIVRSGFCSPRPPPRYYSEGDPDFEQMIFDEISRLFVPDFEERIVYDTSQSISWAMHPKRGDAFRGTVFVATLSGRGHLFECKPPPPCPTSAASSVRSVPACGHIRCTDFADLNNHDPHRLNYHGSHYTTCGGGSVRIDLDGTVTHQGPCSTPAPSRFYHESDLDGDLLAALKAIGFGLKTPTVDFVEVTKSFSHAVPPIRAEFGRPSFVTLGGKGDAFRCDVVECPSSSSSSPPPPSSSSQASIGCDRSDQPACSNTLVCCPDGHWTCWDESSGCFPDCSYPTHLTCNTCGNGTCESHESAEPCVPRGDGSGCDGNIHCPADCRLRGDNTSLEEVQSTEESRNPVASFFEQLLAPDPKNLTAQLPTSCSDTPVLVAEYSTKCIEENRRDCRNRLHTGEIRCGRRTRTFTFNVPLDGCHIDAEYRGIGSRADVTLTNPGGFPDPHRLKQNAGPSDFNCRASPEQIARTVGANVTRGDHDLTIEVSPASGELEIDFDFYLTCPCSSSSSTTSSAVSSSNSTSSSQPTASSARTTSRPISSVRSSIAGPNECIEVRGDAPDECGPAGSRCTDSSSSVPDMHLACVNGACILQAGPGRDECSPFVGCPPGPGPGPSGPGPSGPGPSGPGPSGPGPSGPGPNECRVDGDCSDASTCTIGCCDSGTCETQNRCSGEESCNGDGQCEFAAPVTVPDCGGLDCIIQYRTGDSYTALCLGTQTGPAEINPLDFTFSGCGGTFAESEINPSGTSLNVDLTCGTADTCIAIASGNLGTVSCSTTFALDCRPPVPADLCTDPGPGPGPGPSGPGPSGPGPSGPGPGPGPGPDEHLECVRRACVVVPGAGQNLCSSDADCEVFHTECNSATNECELVLGEGQDECDLVLGCSTDERAICVRDQCVVVQESGPNECSSTVDCGQHTECQNDQCVLVNSPGQNQCSTGNDCLSHRECNNEQCVVVQGPGQDTCSSNADCARPETHLECRSNQCTPVLGAGRDECSQDQDCIDPETHLECQNQQCVVVNGAGQDECQVDADCTTFHTECRGASCELVAGAGQDECDIFLGCDDERAICQDNMCLISNESGPNECSGTIDCNEHTECRDEQCIVVEGAGENECLNLADCIDRETHLECRNLACEVVAGPGQDECSSDSDCSHLECVNSSCILVDGSGNDQCLTDADCTHLECVEQQCQIVDGPGDDTCQFDFDCIGDFHTECEADACIIVDGPGRDECSIEFGCGEEQHLECFDAQCITVAGSGPNDCQEDVDCGEASSASSESSVSFSGTSSEISGDSSSSVVFDFHLECRNGACTLVEGPGEDTCSLFIPSCDGTHTECQGLECVRVDGDGEDECDELLGCGINEHFECNAQEQCIIVDGQGPNTCSEFFECGIVTRCNPDTLECERVRGSGTNECINSDDCRDPFSSASSFSQFSFSSAASSFRPDFHLECIDNACVVVPGGGVDSCNPLFECSTDSHLECDNERCVPAEGAGANDCLADIDCRGERSSSFSAFSEPSACASDEDCPDGQVCLDGLCFDSLVRDTFCGNNIVNVGEECDDGNREDGDGCSADCLEQPLVLSASICGNGVLEDSEECDDGNARDDDGCSAVCLLEIGICGDGIVQALLGEQCEASLHSDALPYGCERCRFVSTLCGDGTVDPGEECDLGDQNSFEPDADCRPDCSAARCGDLIQDSAEQCDDGNRLNTDGCDRYCRIEGTKQPEQVPTETGTEVASDVQSPFTTINQQFFNFPQRPTFSAIAPTLPLAQLQPLVQTQAPVGDTGPATVAVVGAGMAAGWSWVRRRRK